MNSSKRITKLKFTFDKGVTIPSLIFIVGICLFSVLFPVEIKAVLDAIKNFIFVNLNWVYVWCVTIFVIFLVFLMFSKYGKIRWVAMTANLNILSFPGSPCFLRLGWE